MLHRIPVEHRCRLSEDGGAGTLLPTPPRPESGRILPTTRTGEQEVEEVEASRLTKLSLNSRPVFCTWLGAVCKYWSLESGLNRRPVLYEGTALPLSYRGMPHGRLPMLPVFANHPMHVGKGPTHAVRDRSLVIGTHPRHECSPQRAARQIAQQPGIVLRNRAATSLGIRI